MSLNHVVDITPKSWFNAGFRDLTVQRDFSYHEIDRNPGDVMQLVKQVSGALVADWIAPAPSSLYNNQADLRLQNKTYASADSIMTFTGFKYTPPPFINLSADKRTVLVSSEGFYICTCTFVTNELNKTAIFAVYLDDDLIQQSQVSFIPNLRIADPNVVETTTCTCTFIFQAGVGINSLQIRCSPSTSMNISASVMSIIKMN